MSIEDLMEIEVSPSQKALWWTENWPLVATTAGALGIIGYLIFKKK